MGRKQAEATDPLSVQAVGGPVGLLVSVQCIASPLEEELHLWFMKEVETLAKNQRGSSDRPLLLLTAFLHPHASLLPSFS